MTGSTGNYSSYSVQRDFEKAQRDATATWGNPNIAKNAHHQSGGLRENWHRPRRGKHGQGPRGCSPDCPARIHRGRGFLRGRTQPHPRRRDFCWRQGREGRLRVSSTPNPGRDPFCWQDRRGTQPALPGPAAFPSRTPSMCRTSRASASRSSASSPPWPPRCLRGRPTIPGSWPQLEATLKKTEMVAPAIIRELSFEDAIAARRFLNQLASTLRTLKAGGVTGLVNPAWATEGTNVADLVKHMSKYKLQFGSAAEGDEPSYLALHRAPDHLSVRADAAEEVTLPERSDSRRSRTMTFTKPRLGSGGSVCRSSWRGLGGLVVPREPI